MRRSAIRRGEKGELPSWFNPEWLTIEEDPINRVNRELGVPLYQSDEADVALSSGGGGDGGGRGGDSGDGAGGWWREEDPYWPLRNWGAHPMRWWTFAFAAFIAGEW